MGFEAPPGVGQGRVETSNSVAGGDPKDAVARLKEAANVAIGQTIGDAIILNV